MGSGASNRVPILTATAFYEKHDLRNYDLWEIDLIIEATLKSVVIDTKDAHYLEKMIRKMENHGFTVIKGEAFLNQLTLNGNNPIMIPLWVPQSATRRLITTTGDITRRIVFNEEDSSTVDMYMIKDLPISMTYTIDKAIEAYAKTRKVVVRTPLTSSISSICTINTERRLAVAVRTGESTLRCKLSRENSSLRRPEHVSRHSIEEVEDIKELAELTKLGELKDFHRLNTTPEAIIPPKQHRSGSLTSIKGFLGKLPTTVPEPSCVEDHEGSQQDTIEDMFSFRNLESSLNVQIVMTD